MHDVSANIIARGVCANIGVEGSGDGHGAGRVYVVLGGDQQQGGGVLAPSDGHRAQEQDRAHHPLLADHGPRRE